MKHELTFDPLTFMTVRVVHSRRFLFYHRKYKYVQVFWGVMLCRRRIMVPSYARVKQSVATDLLVRRHIPEHLPIQQKRCERLRSLLPDDRRFHLSFVLSVFH